MFFAAILLAIVSVVAQAATWDERMFAGDRQRTAGRYAEAVDSYRAAMSAAADERQHAITANNLAALCMELGDREEARKLYRQALDTWQRTLPADAPEIASTLNNMGALYAMEGRYRDAAFYYQRALAIRPLPNTLNNLAEMYRAEGRYSQAEKVFRQLIDTLPADDPTLGTVLNNLGELCRQKGRKAEAREYYHRALAVWERTLGPNHPYKAATMQNLALVDAGRKPKVAATSAFQADVK
jgi:tetratricopeptide (TPR) repeat protein